MGQIGLNANINIRIKGIKPKMGFNKRKYIENSRIDDIFKICWLKIVIIKDGKIYIIEVNNYIRVNIL